MPGRALERSWIVSWLLVAAGFSLSTAFGIFFDGLGITFNERFILEKGSVTREIDQLPGAVYFIASWTMAVAGITCLGLSFAVYVRHQTLRAKEIFDEREERWPELFQAGLLFFIVPAVVLLLKVLGLLS